MRSYGCNRQQHHLNGTGGGDSGGKGSADMEKGEVDEAKEEQQEEEQEGGKETAQEQEQEDDQKGGAGDQPRHRSKNSDYWRASLPPNFLQHSRHPDDNNHKHQLHIFIHQGPVTKSRRLSVEAHPSLIVESMMLYEEEEGILRNHLGGVNLNDDSDDDDSDDNMEEEMLLRILGGDCTLTPLDDEGEMKEEMTGGGEEHNE